MYRLSFATSALFVLLVSSPMPAQDEWQEQARAELLELAKVAGLEGYELKQKVLTGSLRQRRFTNHPLTFDAATDYAVIATCDSDCVDVDLRLYSGTAVEIDSDVERDDYPVVEVSPPRTTLYQVRIIMAHCAANPCRYGIGIFEKPRGD
jgi:hypothetical protein